MTSILCSDLQERMKKSKLFTPISYDFQLIGIVSSVKDHQLAWSLNQTQLFNFKKEEDAIIEFKDLSKITIGYFECKSEFHTHLLIKNKPHFSNNKSFKLVLPELQQFDFFLKLQSQVDDFDQEALISSIRDIETIDYLVKLDLEKIKHKENLLF